MIAGVSLLALAVGTVLASAAGLALGLAAASAVLLAGAAGPPLARADWRGFWRWWRLQTKPLGKGSAVVSASALWPMLRRVLRPDYIWVAYPGADAHKRAYVPPWMERLLRRIVPAGVMRFGDYWGMIVSTVASGETLERSPERVRQVLEEVGDQFPGVPIALAGRLPSLAVRSGLELGPPFTRGDLGTVCMMSGAAREASRLLGKEPRDTTIAVVGSKGFIGAKLVERLRDEFEAVVALDPRNEGLRREGRVLHTNRAKDLAEAGAVMVLTQRGADMEGLAPFVSRGAVVADDTHPEIPGRLRAAMEERGATVLKTSLGDERFRFVPPVPDYRPDDIGGCILEALVVMQRGRESLASQETFDRVADELGFRVRLAPHRNAARKAREAVGAGAALDRKALA